MLRAISLPASACISAYTTQTLPTLVISVFSTTPAYSPDRNAYTACFATVTNEHTAFAPAAKQP